MATKTRPARVVQFAEIEQRFQLVPLRMFGTSYAAVDYSPGKATRPGCSSRRPAGDRTYP